MCFSMLIGNRAKHRAFVQYFKENPFFSDRVLKKEYKYVPPPITEGEKPDENGITESMLDFTWERDIQPSVRDWFYIIFFDGRD